jgi:tetratricopeptide (TPR) repeat protein
MERMTQNTHDRNSLAIVRGLLLSEVAFQEIFRKYQKGQLRFSDIGHWVDDQGQSLLYNLKEICHRTFRNRTKTLPKRQWLLDLAIGSIFHEAMKLRENIYQLEAYRPRYQQYRRRMGHSTYEKDYQQQFERIIAKAEQGTTEGMEETHSLFRDAKAQLIDFFKENRDHPFLVRFLLEHESLLRKVYGARRAKEILTIMFPKGYLDAYQMAGRSYLHSGHHDLAAVYFSKAVRMDPKNRPLQFFKNFSDAMDAYYKNDSMKSLAHFSRLAQSRMKIKGRRKHLRKAEDACRKISLELKEENRLKSSRKASTLADQLKKRYDKI